MENLENYVVCLGTVRLLSGVAMIFLGWLQMSWSSWITLVNAGLWGGVFSIIGGLLGVAQSFRCNLAPANVLLVYTISTLVLPLGVLALSAAATIQDGSCGGDIELIFSSTTTNPLISGSVSSHVTGDSVLSFSLSTPLLTNNNFSSNQLSIEPTTPPAQEPYDHLQTTMVSVGENVSIVNLVNSPVRNFAVIKRSISDQRNITDDNSPADYQYQDVSTTRSEAVTAGAFFGTSFSGNGTSSGTFGTYFGNGTPQSASMTTTAGNDYQDNTFQDLTNASTFNTGTSCPTNRLITLIDILLSTLSGLDFIFAFLIVVIHVIGTCKRRRPGSSTTDGILRSTPPSRTGTALGPETIVPDIVLPPSIADLERADPDPISEPDPDPERTNSFEPGGISALSSISCSFQSTQSSQPGSLDRRPRTGNLPDVLCIMNYERLRAAVHEKPTAVRFLQQHGVLHIQRYCPIGHLMVLRLGDACDRWRCSLRQCRSEVPLRKGTWLESSNLDYETVVSFTYWWNHEMTSVSFCKREMEMGEHAIVDWNNYMREACAAKIIANLSYVGGPGTIVEIDESLFTRCKSIVGRMLTEQWVFGRICRQSCECFLYSVPDRTAAILSLIIRQSIRTGTHIMSDQWQAYMTGIPAMLDANTNRQLYGFSTVNHSRNFVDPTDGTNTQTIESYNGQQKALWNS